MLWGYGRGRVGVSEVEPRPRPARGAWEVVIQPRGKAARRLVRLSLSRSSPCRRTEGTYTILLTVDVQLFMCHVVYALRAS